MDSEAQHISSPNKRSRAEFEDGQTDKKVENGAPAQDEGIPSTSLLLFSS